MQHLGKNLVASVPVKGMPGGFSPLCVGVPHEAGSVPDAWVGDWARIRARADEPQHQVGPRGNRGAEKYVDSAVFTIHGTLYLHSQRVYLKAMTKYVSRATCRKN